MDNIGARRLHTVLERILEEVSFDAPEEVRAAILNSACAAREAGLSREYQVLRIGIGSVRAGRSMGVPAAIRAPCSRCSFCTPVLLTSSFSLYPKHAVEPQLLLF